jgi:acetylornithine deacetylase/succinyl-diaminopimelate desuccinylase-like protein
MDSVLKYLAANQARFVDELCHYVRFRSVSAQPQHAPDMKACADWLVKHCRAIGLQAEARPTEGKSHRHRQNAAN